MKCSPAMAGLCKNTTWLCSVFTTTEADLRALPIISILSYNICYSAVHVCFSFVIETLSLLRSALLKRTDFVTIFVFLSASIASLIDWRFYGSHQYDYLIRLLKTSALALKPPARSVDDQTHEYTGEDTGTWKSDYPTTVNPSNHSPIDCSPGTRAETNANRSTGDTLSGRDW